MGVGRGRRWIVRGLMVVTLAGEPGRKSTPGSFSVLSWHSARTEFTLTFNCSFPSRLKCLKWWWWYPSCKLWCKVQVSVSFWRWMQLSKQASLLHNQVTLIQVHKQSTSSGCATPDFALFHQSCRKSHAFKQCSTASALILENSLKKTPNPKAKQQQKPQTNQKKTPNKPPK